jgi:hypothetical protein
MPLKLYPGYTGCANLAYCPTKIAVAAGVGDDTDRIGVFQTNGARASSLGLWINYNLLRPFRRSG